MNPITVQIDINEANIAKIIEQEIANHILNERNYEVKAGTKNGIEKAVKEYIYVNKDSIIEKVVDRATAEIVKKGIPKLLERGELK